MAEKILMLALSPTMEEGSIVRWNRSEGDEVASGELLCEVETDKATMEYESPAAGTLLKIIVPEGRSARVADPIAVIGKKGEDISGLLAEEAAAPETPSSAESAAPVEPQPSPPADRVRASPLARGLARRMAVDLSRIAGSGPGGRIVKRDIDGFAAAASPPSAPEDQTIPVTGKRKIIAQRLSESKFGAPHYYLKLSIVMDGLLDARRRLNAGREKKVSLNAFLIKLTAEALKRHPAVNAAWMGDSIRRFAAADIGLAVAVPDGLMTPVVRNCGDRGIVEIDEILAALIEKTRQGKLLPEEYGGATFTITNLGSYGIEEFTAIINPPGSAILALGMIDRQLRLDGAPESGERWKDHVVMRSMMRATLSCDHRVIDGAVGAAFLSELKRVVEDPIQALY